jgi:Domain of unknown function (DUF1814).
LSNILGAGHSRDRRGRLLTKLAQVHDLPWGAEIADAQWVVFRAAIAAARDNQIPFALGGAVALAYYTRQWRPTKDLDMYVKPDDRERLIAAIREAGLRDLFDEQPYDRRWIYRSHIHNVIVDIIWAMANLTAEVDDAWLNRGPILRVRGVEVRVLPPEELVWTKLYVLQRDRCDWPDILNILCSAAPSVDWAYLLERIADDAPLLSAVLAVFTWLCPGQSLNLPDWVRERLSLPKSDNPNLPMDRQRACKLDSRPWLRLIPEQPC